MFYIVFVQHFLQCLQVVSFAQVRSLVVAGDAVVGATLTAKASFLDAGGKARLPPQEPTALETDLGEEVSPGDVGAPAARPAATPCRLYEHAIRACEHATCAGLPGGSVATVSKGLRCRDACRASCGATRLRCTR